MAKEVWKNIEGYEGLYQVSNFGNVKTLKRKVQHGNCFYTREERILKQSKDKYGYCVVGLSRNKATKTYKVHRLVAEAFIPNTDGFPQVNHKDFDRANNNTENLEWCDVQYNTQYSVHRRAIVRNNRNAGFSGEKNIHFRNGVYRVQIRNRKIKVSKYFKTLESAICYRNEVLNGIGYTI